MTVETDKKEISEWDEPTNKSGLGAVGATPRRNRWDETPQKMASSVVAETPKRRSRWDETPVQQMGAQTPRIGMAGVGGITPLGGGVTPLGGMSMMTPLPGSAGSSSVALKIEREIDDRNRPWTEEELNAQLPSDGYEILAPPAGYVPIMTPARKLMSTPVGVAGTSGGFFIPEDQPRVSGGAGDQSLEDQERHLLVKVIDRVLYKLDDLVRPFVRKILSVIEPYLIDQNYYARVEAREIISNLSKAAGLASMTATMRPDIDSPEEDIRNTTARAFAVVASALGIPSLLPFLRAVCKSKKSWQARHTGIKIIQQIAILMGCAILPHLKSMVEIVEHGLNDDQPKVRTITALAIAALAEAATPYGIESFDSVLKPLWYGIRQYRDKGLAAFLKAIGYIIPLMDARYASYYTKEVMTILVREFKTNEDEMKKIILKVVKQCVGTEGVEAQYIRDEVVPEFFKQFWVRRMADRRNHKQLVETTVEIANKVGGAEVIAKIVDDLKDESEPYRKMVMEAIEKIISSLGASDINPRLEEQLIDGVLYAFQEQSTDETLIMLQGFGTIVLSLGVRVKPYLTQIAGTIKWRLNNKSAKVRQQAADLISRIAVVMQLCGEEQLMSHLGQILYEYLGEEYPEVLGSILGALKSIVNVIGMTKMTPPIKDLLPRLTPILKNRHEKVQENCIDLVGRIADRGADFVLEREWMRICFELLDMLKAHKKGIRRATVNTFGYIAKAIGPQEVLGTLLNNLKVQDRQNRVCTTIAIAIVAETCAPYTVLPGLMNEYRIPELNVQNGVLKSLSFLFEYIGEMGKDYIYAVTPLLEDALMDRDPVHRQTACSAVKHMSLGVHGLGCEDALIHLLNYVWPNIFETSPHVINAFLESVEGLRTALGPTIILQYTLQGLFHPARKVRDIYWKVYNMLYISSQDAMIPAYPRAADDGPNTYTRYELDYMSDTTKDKKDSDKKQQISKRKKREDDEIISIQDALNDHVDAQKELYEEAVDQYKQNWGDEDKCTFDKGYITQPVYACKDCPGTFGFCFGCSMQCHLDHDIIELFKKRAFRCDCGTKKAGSTKCILQNNKVGADDNTENQYNQNFSGKYCYCKMTYNFEEDMVQCLFCYEWFHETCIKLNSNIEIPDLDEMSDFICGDCILKNQFLVNYPNIRLFANTDDHKDHTEKDKDDKEKDKENGNLKRKVDGKDEEHNNNNIKKHKKDDEIVDVITVSTTTTTTTNNNDNNDENVKKEEIVVCKWNKQLKGLNCDLFCKDGWRNMLCRCGECMKHYETQKCMFIFDKPSESDDDDDGEKSKKEDKTPPNLFTEMDTVFKKVIPAPQQDTLLQGYSAMKDKLSALFASKQQSSEVITKQDIQAIFSELAKKKQAK
ncbi:HEAT repeat-containing protein [Heterostelium album PN500]|uniref:HEAT repeat-containing protein n=1 Tax=Heterostelium pallidum (strain ATCC 26659 / Pp 5 / PN500) TaxID=670386 RepID=D3BBT9_HETP5|nr:HEAT repeat-containing protein [Heterostelium album PN500]EFA81122.1 HEAT repeat-containing protein [Heterostelium album PN500]|eukprot:XP_020433240.1 HEAT repeat-containing protein [Heterostelium album PN500]